MIQMVQIASNKKYRWRCFSLSVPRALLLNFEREFMFAILSKVSYKLHSCNTLAIPNVITYIRVGGES